jgi:hypothetical protein
MAQANKSLLLECLKVRASKTSTESLNSPPNMSCFRRYHLVLVSTSCFAMRMLMNSS